jgi:hypothetical protein
MTTTPFDHALLTPRNPNAAFGLSTTSTGWFTPTVLALGAVSLGLALQVNYGQYHPAAMPWLTMSLIACIAAVVVPNFGRVTVVGWRPDQLILAVALAVQFALLYSHAPAATLKIGTRDDLAPFKAGVALAAALAAVGISGTRIARFAVPALLLSHFVLGVWVIRATPAPGVDVYMFQHDAIDALLHGQNPYSITFPDIYGGTLPISVYGPGVAEHGRLNFGYPYLPLSLMLAIPGHLLGDFRYAQLFALTLAGGLIAYARPVINACPSARAVAAATLLLFTPRGFFVVEAGWIEPFAILMLAATVYAACRRGRGWAIACAVAFGLLIASKQYIVLAVPLMMLLPVRNVRLTVLIGFVVAAVTLPLVLWDFKAFLHSAVTLQFRQPFRADSLSYLVPLTAGKGSASLAYLSFAAAAVAGLLALWRSPRTPAGFAAAFALVFFAFFATSKQAFCNYYALVLAAMCCALAATPGVMCEKPRRL